MFKTATFFDPQVPSIFFSFFFYPRGFSLPFSSKTVLYVLPVHYLYLPPFFDSFSQTARPCRNFCILVYTRNLFLDLPYPLKSLPSARPFPRVFFFAFFPRELFLSPPASLSSCRATGSEAFKHCSFPLALDYSPGFPKYPPRLRPIFPPVSIRTISCYFFFSYGASDVLSLT